jgi:hypothetical protein
LKRVIVTAIVNLRGKILIWHSRLHAQFVTGKWLEPESSPVARRHCSTVRLTRLALMSISWVGFAVFCGCSGQNAFLSGGPSTGQLKTSLSQVELENDQLKRKVAKLEQESRGLEDRLVQEQINNGDIAARLDDARNLLRDRGIDADTRLGSHRSEGRSQVSSSGDDDDPGARTLPASQSSRKRRKPPFARIPGRVDDAPRSQDDDKESDSADAGRGSQLGGRVSRSGDLNRQSLRTSQRPWLPVAASNDDGLSLVR